MFYSNGTVFVHSGHSGFVRSNGRQSEVTMKIGIYARCPTVNSVHVHVITHIGNLEIKQLYQGKFKKA